MVQVDAVFTVLLNIKNKYISTWTLFMSSPVITCLWLNQSRLWSRWSRVANQSVRHSPGVRRRQQKRHWGDQTSRAGLWPGRKEERDGLRRKWHHQTRLKPRFFFFLKDLGVGYFISFFLKKSNRNSSHFDFFDQSPDWIRLFSSVKLIDVNVTARLWLAGRGGWMNPVWIIQTVWRINPQGQKTWM